MTLTTGQTFKTCKYKISKIHISIYSRNNFLRLNNKALRGKFVHDTEKGLLIGLLIGSCLMTGRGMPSSSGGRGLTCRECARGTATPALDRSNL